MNSFPPASLDDVPLWYLRLTVTRDAVLPLRVAVRLLPMGDARSRAWLHGRGLVSDLDGKRVVVWGDVVDEIRNGDGMSIAQEVGLGTGGLVLERDDT